MSTEISVKKWEKFLQINFLLELRPDTRKRLILINVSIAVLIAFLSIRMGFTSLATNEGNKHLYGHSAIALGRFWKLFGLMIGTGFMSLSCYRIACATFLSKRSDIITKVLQETCSHDDGRLMNRLHRATVIVTVMTVCAANSLLVIFWLINMRASRSWIEITCWTLWLLVDLVPMTITCATFTAVNSVIFVMLYHHYTQCNEYLRLLSGHPVDNRRMILHYHKLIDDSVAGQLFLAPIITIVVCFAPIFTCLLIFTASQLTGHLQVFFTIATFCYALPNTILLLFYAKVDKMSQKIHHRTTSLSSRILDRRFKLYMLSIADDLGSESSLLGMYTIDGNRYSVLSFATYLPEIVTNYLLVLTLRSVFETR